MEDQPATLPLDVLQGILRVLTVFLFAFAVYFGFVFARSLRAWSLSGSSLTSR
jgi:hypothetical protein